jgi:hypothetical protein
LLDPVIAAKVNFTNNTADLEKYIPKENLISSLGGTENWRYRYHEPSEDEDATIAQADVREKILDERREIANRFLTATQYWIQHLSAGEREEAAIQAQLRSNGIEALRTNYWKLDPYVRSRMNLDRTGVIKPGGSIELHPERKVGTRGDRKDMSVRNGGAAVGGYNQVAVAS